MAGHILNIPPAIRAKIKTSQFVIFMLAKLQHNGEFADSDAGNTRIKITSFNVESVRNLKGMKICPS
jgi:hypothetical protein